MCVEVLLWLNVQQLEITVLSPMTWVDDRRSHHANVDTTTVLLDTSKDYNQAREVDNRIGFIVNDLHRYYNMADKHTRERELWHMQSIVGREVKGKTANN